MVWSRSVAAALVAAACIFGGVGATEGTPHGRTAAASISPRAKAVSRIVLKWSPVAYSTYGTPPSKWARAMGPTFARASVDALTRAADARTYSEFMGMLSLTSPPAALAAAVSGLSSPVTKNLVYTVITPCRIVDTRNVAKRFAAGQTQRFLVNGGTAIENQGGSRYGCNIPQDVSAVALNVIAVYPDSSGYLTIFPSDKSQPLASSLNYRSADIVANEVLATVARDSSYAYFSIYSQAGADVVVDVAGYFSAAKPRPLDCTQLQSSPVSVPAGEAVHAASPACPTTHLATGGGCNSSAYPSTSGIYFFGSGVTSGQRYGCSARNKDAAAQSIVVDVVCCRVPG